MQPAIQLLQLQIAKYPHWRFYESEVAVAIKSLKRGKGPGLDYPMTAEVLKEGEVIV